MVALISSDYIVKNHLQDILLDFPQVVFFNSNDEEMRDESHFNQFEKIMYCNSEITAYTEMKISKYAPEKKVKFSNLYDLKNYLSQLKSILN